MVKVRDDLIGRIYGNFLVLSRAEDYVSPKGSHRAQWNCQCLLCGSTDVVIMDTVLKKGTKASCGCIEDLSGKKFGRLTVVCKDGQDQSGNTLWKCICDCGNEISVSHNRLTSKNVQSCGCLRKDSASERFSKKNVYNIDGDFGIGYTSNTNQPFYFDLEDFELIKQYTWYEEVSDGGYHSLKARDNNTNKVIKMSYLLGCKRYDHKNRNPLDNRKENLRPATDGQNAQNRTLQSNNTSGFTGVCWDKEANKWLAYIRYNKKPNKLGRFVNKNDAILARLQAEAKHFKEFAPQRHLFAEYGIELEEQLSDKNTI